MLEAINLVIDSEPWAFLLWLFIFGVLTIACLPHAISNNKR